MIRKRAGVPDIEEVYPDAAGDQTRMRELIRRERQVELCFENLRYFDTRTWMTAETDNNMPVYGMNISAKDPPRRTANSGSASSANTTAAATATASSPSAATSSRFPRKNSTV